MSLKCEPCHRCPSFGTDADKQKNGGIEWREEAGRIISLYII